MIARTLRLVRQQVNVQFQTRLYNLYSVGLYFIQPAVFSLVGMLLSRAAGNPRPDLVYTVIGSGVLGMWSGLVFSSLYDIRADRREGTLEFIVASPTSLGTVEAIRTLANVLTGLVSLLGAFLVAVLVFDYSFAGVSLAAVLVSLLVLLVGLWSLGVFLANFTVWSRLSGSYVEFLEIPVALVCGFMYPIGILPVWMQTISAIFPVRWALEAMNAALTGSHDLGYLAQCWGLGLLLSFIFWLITRLLEGRVHDRIRVTGEMRSI